MKNYTKIFIISLTAFMISATTASAASITVSPSVLSKKVNDSFVVSVGVSTGGSKVCVVEGTLTFDKLSCSSITVADGLMAQTAPTCAKPTFSIGIPSCTTSDRSVLSISLKAPTAGTATLGFTGVDIVGEGMSVGTSAGKGEYTVVGVEPVTLTVTPKPIEETTTVKPSETVKKPAASIPTAPENVSEPEVEKTAIATTSEAAPATDADSVVVPNNLAAAATASRGVSFPWVIGIVVLALILGYIAIKKMKK
ncbi:MAG: hypothetical protein WCT49_02095 [Candidatus Paceibacterota bacterium]|nr:hypothetical protein [Candidatus Paceibacterota bacterium]